MSSCVVVDVFIYKSAVNDTCLVRFLCLAVLVLLFPPKDDQIYTRCMEKSFKK
jgi:hypothetical protein